MATVKLPDGKIVKVPDGLNEQQVRELLIERLPDDYAEFKTKLQRQSNPSLAAKDARDSNTLLGHLKENVDDWDVLRTAGGAVGSGGGAYAGALGGAALGSVVPVVGTALGGIAGGILGGIAGGAVGGAAGEAAESKIQSGEVNTDELTEAAISEGAWGALPGVGAIGGKVLGRGVRQGLSQVANNPITRTVAPGLSERVAKGLTKTSDLPYSQRTQAAKEALEHFGVDTAGATPASKMAYDKAREGLLKGVAKDEATLVREAAKGAKRTAKSNAPAVNQVRSQIAELEAKHSSLSVKDRLANNRQIDALKKQLKELEATPTTSATKSPSATEIKASSSLREKRQALKDLMLDEGIPGSDTQVREIEKQITAMAEKVVKDFNAGKGVHPSVADSEFFKATALPGKGKRAKLGDPTVPTQDALDEIKKQFYDEAYKGIIEGNLRNRLPWLTGISATGRTAANVYEDGGGFAEGGMISGYAQGGKTKLDKKISKIYKEGYDAPGQAYAIAKSMGYKQGGLIGCK